MKTLDELYRQTCNRPHFDDLARLKYLKELVTEEIENEETRQELKPVAESLEEFARLFRIGCDLAQSGLTGDLQEFDSTRCRIYCEDGEYMMTYTEYAINCIRVFASKLNPNQIIDIRYRPGLPNYIELATDGSISTLKKVHRHAIFRLIWSGQTESYYVHRDDFERASKLIPKLTVPEHNRTILVQGNPVYVKVPEITFSKLRGRLIVNCRNRLPNRLRHGRVCMNTQGTLNECVDRYFRTSFDSTLGFEVLDSPNESR